MEEDKALSQCKALIERGEAFRAVVGAAVEWKETVKKYGMGDRRAEARAGYLYDRVRALQAIEEYCSRNLMEENNKNV